MKLIELYIENFGKLQNFKYAFSSGLNVINEDNGYGKSTLTVFIKSMLYGLEDTRKTKLEENDRKHYMPWQGGVFGGTLTFSASGKTYRIERSFGSKASDDTFTLYDCESGKESADYGRELGEQLFGINADGFERTVFLSEKKLSVANDNKTISAKLSDLVGCDGDVGELDDAIAALEARRKYYQKKGGAGRISEIKNLISATELEINDVERIKDALPEKEARLAKMSKEIRALEHKIADFNSQRQTLSYEKQYLAKKAARDETEKKIAASKKFFENGIPTQAEIRAAERCVDEYRAVKSRVALKKEAPDRTEALERDTAEASELIDKLKNPIVHKSANKGAYALFIAAAAAILAGILLGLFVSEVILYASLALSAAFALVGVIRLLRKGKDRSAEELEQRARAFLSREGMGFIEEKDRLTALLEIKVRKENERKRYEEEREEIAVDEERMRALSDEYRAFIGKFPVTTTDPFTEIRNALSESDYLESRLRELNAELAYFVREYGLNVEKLNNSGSVIINELTDRDRAESEEKLRRMRAELAILDRECRRDGEEISRLDELNAKRNELCDTLEICRATLDTINLTKEHLTGAKDTLTAKYLGKTKSAFAEYVRAIGNDDPELFSMDTSFAVMRSEGAHSKPAEAYSLGTRDFFALAARLALVDSLYESESPFILLDDPFAHFDDRKTATALKLLKKLADKKQIVYFTCSKSRAV